MEEVSFLAPMGRYRHFLRRAANHVLIVLVDRLLPRLRIPCLSLCFSCSYSLGPVMYASFGPFVFLARRPKYFCSLRGYVGYSPLASDRLFGSM